MIPADLLLRWQKDPVDFARRALGVPVTPSQAEILMALVDNREVAVKSHHSAGKSYLAAIATLWFLYCHHGSRVVTTAPTDRQVKGILWTEIGKLHKNSRMDLGGHPMTQHIIIEPGWDAQGFTAPKYDPDRFQGFHAPHILVIVDEAAGITSRIYEGIKSLTTGQHSVLLHIGNPTNEAGDFGLAFKRAAGVAKFSLSVFDHPNLTHFGITIEDIRKNTWKEKVTGPLPWPSLVSPDWVYTQWSELTEEHPMWDARVLGRFPRNDSQVLAGITWVEQAFDRWDEVKAWSPSKKLGVDLAAEGKDWTTVADCRAEGVKAVWRQPKTKTDETTGRLIQLMEDDVVSMRVDAGGLGLGIFDPLKRRFQERMVGMLGARKSRFPEKYLNQRCEWLWNLRERLDPSRPDAIALPRSERLMNQITGQRWSVNEKGVTVFAPKEDVAKSPDEMDAIAYGLAVVVNENTAPIVIDPSAGYAQNPWRI